MSLLAFNEPRREGVAVSANGGHVRGAVRLHGQAARRREHGEQRTSERGAQPGQR